MKLRTVTSTLIFFILFSSIPWLSGPASAQAGPGDIVPVNLPSCGTSNPESLILGAGADLRILNNDTTHRVFCLQNGTYGGFVLRRSGTEAKPLYLRLAPGATRDQVVINGVVELAGADWWVIDQLTIDSTEARLIRFKDGAENNVLNQIVVQHGWTLVSFVGGSHNTIQKSILRNSQVIPNTDSHCIVHHRDSRFNRIIENEFIDCAGDGIQTLETGHGLVIAGNEFSITDALHSDCNGQFSPGGPCICAENALDVKAAADNGDPDGLLIFQNNILYGYNGPVDALCGGSTSGNNPAAAIAVHKSGAEGARPAKYVLLENNVFFNTQIGIRYPKSSPEHITIRNNLFYALTEAGISIDATPDKQEIYHNTFIGASDTVPWIRWSRDKSPGAADIRNNLIINSAGMKNEPLNSQAVTVDYNVYLDTNQDAVSSNEIVLPYNPGLGRDYCLILHKHTNQETFCLAGVVPNPNHPAIDAGDPKVGNEGGIGIDNMVGLPSDLLNHGRTNPPDIGAIEYFEPIYFYLPFVAQ